jgi:hypothetical protein
MVTPEEILESKLIVLSRAGVLYERTIEQLELFGVRNLRDLVALSHRDVSSAARGFTRPVQEVLKAIEVVRSACHLVALPHASHLVVEDRATHSAR